MSAQVIHACVLPGTEGHYEPRTELLTVADEPARAFAWAAPAETIESTLLAEAPQSEPPVELWPDAKHFAVPLPPSPPRDPLRTVEPPAWMLVGAATAILASVNTRHHRRRARAGRRHLPRFAIPIKKPRPAPWVGESAAVSTLAIPGAAH